MSEGKIIVGLDIGTTKVACIVGRKSDKGKIEILGYGKTVSTGVRRGVVTNIFDTVEAIKTAVKQASDQSGVEINRVSVGIAGQHIKSLQHRGVLMRDHHDTEISEAELERLRNDTFKINMTPGEEIIDVIRQDTYVDGELATNPVGMLGNKIEANFHVIIGQTSAAKNIIHCIQNAGLDMDYMILEPIASAQAVLDEEEKDAGVVLVDIGGGTTDIAVISLGGPVVSESVKVAGDDFDEAIIRFMRKKHNLLIGERTAEDIKIGVGCVYKRPENLIMEVRGRNLVTGLPKTVQVTSDETQDAFAEPASQIVNAVHNVLERTPPELASDIYERGIVMTGGGSLLSGLDELIEEKTGINTVLAASPMTAVAVGTGQFVDYMNESRRNTERE